MGKEKEKNKFPIIINLKPGKVLHTGYSDGKEMDVCVVQEM